ncbi:hypothetical protein Tco_1432299, partial [Tanacetum coccineum]
PQSPPPPQGDNQTQPQPPPSPSREMLVDEINQLQDQSSSCFVMNKVRSIEPLENPLDTRKLESSPYHARGDCLSLYNAFLRRETLLAYAMNILTASNRATGANDSLKSIPSA